jgi:transcriptional regulator with XRE-family HTH domain
MSIGEKIREARKIMGITQKALAKMAGLELTQICHYEAENREPSVSNLRKLAVAMGISADYLLEIKPYDREGNHDGD